MKTTLKINTFNLYFCQHYILSFGNYKVAFKQNTQIVDIILSLHKTFDLTSCNYRNIQKYRTEYLNIKTQLENIKEKMK